MSKDIDGVDFVTDNNTGGYFVMECQNCGEVFNSKQCNGGESIADTGDYGDCYCPHCGEVDPMECDNANLVWNFQQKKINQLNQKFAELLDVQNDHHRLVRELDVLLNGVDGAAPQASLCDLVAQLKAKGGAA
ncbi:hypothetical protein ACV1DR_10660 [Aeromonas jandaei]